MTTYFETPEEPLLYQELNLPVSESHSTLSLTKLRQSQIRWLSQLPEKLNYLAYLLGSIHFKEKSSNLLTSKSILDGIIYKNKMNRSSIKFYGVPQVIFYKYLIHSIK